jgi:hypothetical protein
MRCAGEQNPAGMEDRMTAALRPASGPGRKPAGRRGFLPAAVLAAVLATACTAAHPGGPAAGRSASAHRSFRQIGAGGGVVIFQGGGRNNFVVLGSGFSGGFTALPGAGPAGSTGRPRISVPRIPPASSPVAVAMPLDNYEQVAVQQQDALAAASDLLTQQCMQAAGFSYTTAAEPGGGVATVQSLESSGYGLTSLAQAQYLGYKQPAHGSGAGPEGLVLPGFVGQANKHGTAWTSALLGFIPGARVNAPRRQGCLQAAYLELYGTLSGNPNPDPVPAIAIQSVQWTQSDPRVLAVQRAWSACMARRGLTYKTPGQPEDRGWPSAPTPAEIATAVADVQCKTRTNLVNTWLTVEAAYQQALTSQNSASLAQLQANFGALQRSAELALQAPAASGVLRISRAPVGSRGNRAG